MANGPVQLSLQAPAALPVAPLGVFDTEPNMHTRPRILPILTTLLLCALLSERAFAQSEQPGTGGICVVTFDAEVDPSSVASFKRRLQEAVDRQADVILIDLNTWGGRIDSAEEAGDAIYNLGPGGDKDSGPSIPTFIYVRNGFSAGTYFILATPNEILMERGSTWGACAPIQPGEILDLNMRKKAEAIIQSALLRYTSARRDYSEAAVKALITSEVRLFEVRTDLDETLYWTGDERESNAIYYNVISEKEIVTDHDLLLVNEELALQLGFCKQPAFDNREAAIEYIKQEVVIGDVSVHVLEPTAVDTVVGIFNIWWVRVILLIIGFTGVIIEFQVPGFGAPGITGIVCLGLYFGSSYLAGVADWVSIIFLLLGFVLLMLEFFVIPGFGVVGVLGFLSVFAGLFTAIYGTGIPDISDPFSSSRVFEGLVVVFAGLGGSILLGWALSRFLPRSPYLKRLVHDQSLKASDGYVAGNADAADLIGKFGRTATTLRPSGKIRLEGRVLDAESDGSIIEADVEVEVVRATPMAIVVRERTGNHGA